MKLFAPIVIFVLLFAGIVLAEAVPAAKHLFILSGQSNMDHPVTGRQKRLPHLSESLSAGHRTDKNIQYLHKEEKV